MDPLEAAGYWEAVSAYGLDIVIALDRGGLMRSVNRVIPPLQKEQMAGLSWLTFIPPEKQAWLQAELERVLETGKPFSYELMAIGPHGTNAWYACLLAPVRNDEVITGALLITRDVTDKKEREAQLIASDRMAAIGTLAAGVAHEINNPLAVVMSNLDLALLRVSRGDSNGVGSLIEELVDARAAADRVRVIVKDLKLFSRSADDQMTSVDLHVAIESTLRMAANEIRHRAHLVKELGPIPLVLANEARLGQVLLNIIVNAAHAIPQGQTERNEVRVVTRVAPDGMVAVDITDTGVGMSEELQKRIFMPFFTTKEIGEGIGLGLSISHAIVRSLGGEIRVRSREGAGSTFTILLRAAASAELAPSVATVIPASTVIPAPLPLRRGTILIVDDEPAVAKSLQRCLAKDHEVIVELVPSFVIERLQLGERFDVIFSDLMMPEMTGMDLYASIREIDAAQADRMIFVTGGASTATARAFLDGVPNLCVEKPFEPLNIRALAALRVASAPMAKLRS